MRTFEGRLAAALILCVVTPTPAAALLQEPDARPPAPDSAIVIEPVMVRVLRSAIGAESPVSVSVVAGRELTRGAAGAFLEEALRAVPGVQIQNRFNFAVGERVAVRGFGPRAQFGVRGVRILVDGIPATLPDGQATIDHLDLAALGRVEVLRGPSSALYGNAAGGVIHFRTLDPALAASSVSLGTTSGSHGLLTLNGALSGRSGDVGYRVGFSQLGYDGYRRDPVADDGSTYGQAARTVVNGTLSVPLGGGVLRFVANGLDLDADNPGSLSTTLQDQDYRQAYQSNVTGRLGKTIRQGQLGAAWSRSAGDGETELAVWGVRRELENPIPGTVIGVDRNTGGIRALAKRGRATGFGSLGLGAGFELELMQDDRHNWENVGGEPGALTLSQLERVRGAGLFLQARADIEERVSLVGGLRYDRIRFSADDRFVEPGDPDDSGVRTMDAISPSAGFVVEATPDVELFGSVARSFETPTTTELVNRPTGAGGFNPDLEPQRGLTVEGGLRGRVGDAMAFEATLFRTDLEDDLVPFEVPTDPGRQYFRNAGESRHTGWEVSLDGRPTAGARARIAYTHVNARFRSFVTETDDHSGNRVPGLAPDRLDVLAILTRGPAFLEARALYQGEVPVDDAGQFSSPDFFVADARAGLERVAVGDVLASPYVAVANLFDRRYNSSVTVNAFGGRYFEPGPGRSYRIGLEVTWQR